jgi:hypothetical protein
MIERDSSLAARAHFGLAALSRKAGSAAKAQHEMQGCSKRGSRNPRKSLNLVSATEAAT